MGQTSPAGAGSSAAAASAGTAGMGSAAVGGTTGSGGSGTGGVAGRTAGSSASGSPGAAGETGGDPNEPSLSGRWAMFDFEDPIFIDVRDQGGVLLGTGSCTPPGPNTPLVCAGPIMGTHAGGQADFGFDAGFVAYSASVGVSADANRMAGTFGAQPLQQFSTAWLRIPDGQSWLEGAGGELDEVVSSRANRYELRVSSADGTVFSSDETYALLLRNNYFPVVSGSLGAFWEGEMAWREGTQTLEIGPVPVTMQELPIALSLRFDDTDLLSVLATMPNGDHYTFTASPTQK